MSHAPSRPRTNGTARRGSVAFPLGVAYTFPDFREQGFILTGAVYRFFSRPGWPNTEPRFIGNSGLVTGWNFNDAGQNAGFVYSPATDMFTDATPGGSDFTIVQGINKSGVISGSGHDATGRFGFIWQQSTFAKPRTVPFFGRFQVANTDTNARGINDAGLVVGFTTDQGRSTGFVGNDVLGFQLLHMPGAADANTYCQGINNFGQVTCAYDNNDLDLHVFIGSPRGGDDHDGDQDGQP